MEVKIRRGQIWWYVPEVERPGNIQKGPRPVIVVSNEMCNASSSVVLVVPCTTQIKRNYPTHVLFVLDNGVSVAMAEQAGPVNVSELNNYKCTLESHVLAKVDDAIKIAYGLSPIVRECDYGY